MSTVLITRANRGIGLALARQYAAEGGEVFACCRASAIVDALKQLVASSGGRVRIMQLDVVDEASIASLKRALGDQPIDILINNEEVIGSSNERIDAEDWIATLRANALGPMLIAQALYDNLRRGSEKKLVAISSIMGSITGAGGAGASRYGYRASKAALNNGMRCLARHWAGDGILVAILDPGSVKAEQDDTEIGLISPEECASGLVRRIAELRPTTSGAFQDYRGVPIRW